MNMYVGLDIHKRTTQVAILEDDGKVVANSKMKNEDEKIDALLEDIDEDSSIVMEACTIWEPMYDHIKSKGFDVKLAHPKKTRMIADAKVKTDKIDAKTLAKLDRADMICESYVPDKDIRKLRMLVRHRRSLVNMRTQIKNKIHSVLMREGITSGLSDLFGKQGRLVLDNIPLKPENRFSINNYLDSLDELNKEIKDTSEYIETRAEDIEEIEILKSVPGIGTYLAMVIYAEIGDVNRFPGPKKLNSYSGLVPSTYQSGEKEIHGHITKEGSKMLRWALVQAVQKTVRKPNAVQKFYLRILKKKGNKIAKVAAARKLLTYIYVMLTQEIKFQDLRVNSA